MTLQNPNLFIGTRADHFILHNGEKAVLPFSDAEYESRLTRLRTDMRDAGQRAVVLTSMQTVAYYSGFLYCSFGRPYACIVTADACITVSAISMRASPGGVAMVII